MGGFTNEEIDELNLGKNFKYPDISGIETNIIPTIDQDTLDPVFKFTIAVLIFLGCTSMFLIYLRKNGMSLGSFFKSLRDKVTFPKSKVSTTTIIVPK